MITRGLKMRYNCVAVVGRTNRTAYRRDFLKRSAAPRQTGGVIISRLGKELAEKKFTMRPKKTPALKRRGCRKAAPSLLIQYPAFLRLIRR
jgi:hypothetical protein